MKLFAAVFSLALVSLVQSAVDDRGPVMFPPTCDCEASGDFPVCATDRTSYTNECSMKCADPNLEVAYKGRCTYGCVCLDWLQPSVCGTDGRQYSSACHAKCAGVKIDPTGACFDSIIQIKKNRFLKKMGDSQYDVKIYRIY